MLVHVQWLDGSRATQIVRPREPTFVLRERPGAWGVAQAYTVLGVEHILFGIDHLLFVLTMAMIVALGPRAAARRGTLHWGALIKTVTAFTLAHSITLGLAALGFVYVPQGPVEAVIALSIVFVAAEIVHARRGVVGITARAPWIVAFVFGLLHGFGFAGALSEIGLPAGQIPLALFWTLERVAAL